MSPYFIIFYFIMLLLIKDFFFTAIKETAKGQRRLVSFTMLRLVVALTLTTLTVSATTLRCGTATQGPSPIIVGFNPVSGVTGTSVTLTGIFLTGASSVTVNGMAVTPTSVTSTSLVFVVPVGAGITQGIAVTTPDGISAISLAFTVQLNSPIVGTSVNNKLLVYCLGDSRTEGPRQGTPWPRISQTLLNQGAGAGHYVVTNAGVSGRMTGYDAIINGASVTGALTAIDATMGNKAQKSTYYRSIVVYQHGVNDLIDPNATYTASLDNVRQAVAKIVANGFDGVFLVNEGQSHVRGWNPAFFTNYNRGLNDMVGTVPGVLGIINLDTLPSIQNMSDPSVSFDGLHFTDAANETLIAPFMVGYLNKYAASVGIATNQAPLPVELVAFTAQQTGSMAVQLAWTTAAEQHSDRFEVERSSDGSTFVRIETKVAAGISSGPRNYSLLDANLPAGPGPLYYRLRQVDIDGSFHYSPVRIVTLVSQARIALALYPNPTRTQATLTGALPGQLVQVLDALGRLVITAPVDDTGTASLALPATLPMGVYMVRAGAQALRLTVE